MRGNIFKSNTKQGQVYRNDGAISCSRELCHRTDCFGKNSELSRIFFDKTRFYNHMLAEWSTGHSRSA